MVLQDDDEYPVKPDVAAIFTATAGGGRAASRGQPDGKRRRQTGDTSDCTTFRPLVLKDMPTSQ